MNLVTNQNLNHLVKVSGEEVAHKFGSLHGRIVEWIKILPSEITKNRVQICKVVAIATVVSTIFYGLTKLIFQKKQNKTDIDTKEPVNAGKVQVEGKGEQASESVKKEEQQQVPPVKKEEQSKTNLDDQPEMLKQVGKEDEGQQGDLTLTKAEQSEKEKTQLLDKEEDQVCQDAPEVKAAKAQAEKIHKYAKANKIMQATDVLLKSALEAGASLGAIQFNSSLMKVLPDDLDKLVDKCPNIKLLLIKDCTNWSNHNFLTKLQKLNSLHLYQVGHVWQQNLKKYFADNDIILDNLCISIFDVDDLKKDFVTLEQPTDEMLNKFIDQNLTIKDLVIQDPSLLTDLSCLIKLKDLRSIVFKNCTAESKGTCKKMLLANKPLLLLPELEQYSFE